MVNLDRPKPPGGDDAFDRDNSAVLAGALSALGVKLKAGAQLLQNGTPVRAADTCTTGMRLRVPHLAGAAGARTFRIGARAQGAPNMQRNGLILTCDTAPPVCGDGILQAGEACDDGNTDEL